MMTSRIKAVAIALSIAFGFVGNRSGTHWRWGRNYSCLVGKRLRSCVGEEGGGSRDRTQRISDNPGSINEVGSQFQSFGINDLEMVDLTGIEPVTSW